METGQKIMTPLLLTITNTNSAITYPRLSVQVSLTGLSFLLQIDSEDHQLWQESFNQKLHPGELLHKIVALYKQNTALVNHKGAVCVIYHHKEFTLVPKALFNPDKLSSYLQYNTKLLASDYLDYDEIENASMVNVYVPFTNINNFFFETYGDFTFLHSNTVFIQAVLPLARQNSHTYVFANIVDNTLDLAVFKAGILQLCNSFTVTCAQDFAYFLLFVVEQLKLDPEALKLVFTNGVAKNDPFYELAYRYIRNVNITTHKADSGSFILKNAFV